MFADGSEVHAYKNLQVVKNLQASLKQAVNNL